MTTDSNQTTNSTTPIPADDLKRKLTLVNADDKTLPHLAIAGDTYTILVTGAQTAGRYCLIDMLIPPGGGPPPHRHDFEEMFSILEGEIELTFRGQKSIARAGQTVNVPANAPHRFQNTSNQPARLLCMCTPAGQDEFFTAIGVPVPGRTSPPPKLTEAEQLAIRQKAGSLAAKFKTEMLPPG